VHRSIANQVAGMLSAADGAGLTLSGGGWRSSDSQIALRRAHCGSSHYDIYEKPASQCSPPTARPGQSMHERGLAIDFTCNGSLIQSRSNPCFQWLSGNAGRFGFRNLPSEPWHWSTTGQ
jgi:LAS superfamily LD-carboxypeptidase LdcB